MPMGSRGCGRSPAPHTVGQGEALQEARAEPAVLAEGTGGGRQCSRADRPSRLGGGSDPSSTAEVQGAPRRAWSSSESSKVQAPSPREAPNIKPQSAVACGKRSGAFAGPGELGALPGLGLRSSSRLWSGPEAPHDCTAPTRPEDWRSGRLGVWTLGFPPLRLRNLRLPWASEGAVLELWVWSLSGAWSLGLGTSRAAPAPSPRSSCLCARGGRFAALHACVPPATV